MKVRLIIIMVILAMSLIFFGRRHLITEKNSKKESADSEIIHLRNSDDISGKKSLINQGFSLIEKKDFKEAYEYFISANDYESALKCARESFTDDSLWRCYSIKKAEFLLRNSLKDIDGNVYHTVKVGNQVWIRENLAVKHFRNGDEIIPIQDFNQISELKEGRNSAIVSNYTQSEDLFSFPNIPTDEKHYTWHTISDSRSIAPEGYHIATLNDWEKVIKLAGGYSKAAEKLLSNRLHPYDMFDYYADSLERSSSKESVEFPDFIISDGRYFYDFWIASNPDDTIYAKSILMTAPNNHVSVTNALKQHFKAVKCVKD